MLNYLNRIKYIFTTAHFKQLGIICLGMFGLGFLEVLSVSSIFPFMAVVANPELIQTNKYLFFVYSFFSFSSEREFLIWSGLSVIILLAITNLFNAVVNWKIIKFANLQIHHLSVRLLRGYLFQPYNFFLNRNSSELSKNILSEVARTIGGVVLPALNTIARAIVTFFLFGFLLYINYVVAFGIFFVIGGSYYSIYRLMRNNLYNRGVASTKADFERYKLSNEAMHGIKQLKLSGNEPSFVKRFDLHSEELYRNDAISSITALMPRYLLETITFGGIVLVLVLLIISGQAGESIIPSLSLYALAGYRLMPALQQIYVGVTQLKYNSPSLDVLVAEFKSLAQASKNTSNQQLQNITFDESINLSSIYFKYQGSSNYTLAGLDLKILRNTTIGLVGSSGSGKTTLVDILLGLLEIDRGEYYVDNTKVQNNNISNWQKNFGYVSQDIFLANDTITNNIAFSVPKDEVDQDKVIKAAKLANMDEFILTLPEGYDTFTGDRGVRLSGGQRQRIAIARALYTNPDILVFDEATSALDGSTENVIMDAIHNLSHNKTIVIIAHRLETVMGCDIIHFVDDGKIVNSGKYDELIKSNKKFRDMARKF